MVCVHAEKEKNRTLGTTDCIDYFKYNFLNFGVLLRNIIEYTEGYHFHRIFRLRKLKNNTLIQ